MTMPFMCSSQRPASWRSCGIPARALLAAFAHAGVEAPGEQFGEVAADGADRGADGHVVVVEDDQQVGVERAAVVERLKGHAGAERAVADDGDDLSALALSLAAMAMPSAALIEVLEWPTPKVSYSLSLRLGKPDRPPFWRMRCMRSRRPVRILCG
jgi:hypothetical protein